MGYSNTGMTKDPCSSSRIKVVDGGTYSLTQRPHPAPGQHTHYRLGDNGRELKLTEDEAAEWEP